MGNIPLKVQSCFRYLELPPTTPYHPLAYPRSEERGFASNIFIIGAQIGARLTKVVPAWAIKAIFGFVFLAVSLKFIWKGYTCLIT